MTYIEEQSEWVTKDLSQLQLTDTYLSDIADTVWWYQRSAWLICILTRDVISVRWQAASRRT